MDSIAIIGAQLRLPGADSLDSFWASALSAANGEATTDTDRNEYSLLDGPASLAWPGKSNRIDLFDHGLFGYTREQAATIDPQQRILLVLAYRLLEQVGMSSDSVGTFVSVGFPYYLLRCLGVSRPTHIPLTELIADNSPDRAATRIAYKLDLRGPAMSIQAGNASALLGVHMARIAILTGQCQTALVGAASLRLAPHRTGGTTGALAAEAAQADRTRRGAPIEALPASGVVMVALKSVQAALRDGNDILGLIRSSEINHDGGRKGSFAEPSYGGYSEAIRRAYEASGISPDTIGYLEAHGTGLAAGDTVEVAALKSVFEARVTRTNFCAFNSTRPDVGQLGVVSGLASLLRAVLCLKYAVKAPFNGTRGAALNALLEQSPFYVPTAAEDWVPTADHPRRAAVSAIGDGCNAHLIIEEAVAAHDTVHEVDTGPLLLSAQNHDALLSIEQDVHAMVARDPRLRGHLRYTSQLQRRHDRHTSALVFASDTPTASRSPTAIRRTHDWSQARVGLLFDARHEPYAGIGRALHARGGHFRATFDDCAAQFAAYGWPDPRELLGDWSAPAVDAAGYPLFIFSLQYALGAFFSAAGLPVVAAFAADEASEYAAAALAGVFSQQDAIHLVSERATLARRRTRDGPAATSPYAFLDAGIDTYRAALGASMPRAPLFRLVASDGGDDAVRYATPGYWLERMQRSAAAARFETAPSPPGYDVLIEIGPGSRESATRSAQPERPARFATLLPGEEAARVDTVLAQCWSNGMPIDWRALYGTTTGNVVPMPPHPFVESPCWYE